MKHGYWGMGYQKLSIFAGNPETNMNLHSGHMLAGNENSCTVFKHTLKLGTIYLYQTFKNT